MFSELEDLTSLDLSNSEISGFSRRLVELTSLTDLNLSNNPLTSEAFQLVGDLLKSCKTLKRLSLKNCKTTPIGATFIIQALLWCQANDVITLTKLE